MIVKGSHLEINLDADHTRLPKAGGQSGVSIEDNRCRKSLDRRDSFNKDVGSSDCCQVLRDSDEIGKPTERILHK